MKKILFAIAALAVVSFSSCYVEVRGEHRYHRPFWHHRDVVVVGENIIKANPLNPVQTPTAIYTAEK